jgi:acyl-CoA dehydrogenase
LTNYFFSPAEYADIGQQFEARSDDFLFQQGPAKGLGGIQFHDYKPIYEASDLPNVRTFAEQATVFTQMLTAAPPTAEQGQDTDFLLSLGEIFTLVVYGQLILENARIHGVTDDVVDQVFDCLVRDFSKFALRVYGKPASTPRQMEHCLKIIKKPVVDQGRYSRVWNDHVLALNGAYEMNP